MTSVATVPTGTVYGDEPKEAPVVEGINDVRPPLLTGNSLTAARFVGLRVAGVLIAAAIYFLLTQTNVHVTNVWHGFTYLLVAVFYAPFHQGMTHDALVQVANALRHAYRNKSESFAAAILPGWLLWNHFKRWRYKKHESPLDRWERKLKIVPNLADGKPITWYQILLLPVVVLVLGGAFFTVGYIISGYLTNHPRDVSWVLTLTHTRGAWHWLTLHGLPKDWPQIVAAYVAGMISRRPIKAAADKLQLQAAVRHYNLNLPFAWYHTRAFRDRVALVSTQNIPFKKPSELRLRTRFVIGRSLLGLCGLLTAFGLFVLIVPAHHLLGW